MNSFPSALDHNRCGCGSAQSLSRSRSLRGRDSSIERFAHSVIVRRRLLSRPAKAVHAEQFVTHLRGDGSRDHSRDSGDHGSRRHARAVHRLSGATKPAPQSGDTARLAHPRCSLARSTAVSRAAIASTNRNDDYLMMKMITGVFATTLAIATVAGCASGGHGSAPCEPRPQDSTYTKSGPVFRECAVQKKAVLITKDLHPVFRPPQGRNSCFAAEAEFVVNSAGAIEMETAHLTRSTDSEFGMAVMTLLPQLRYNPAEVNGVPVRQIVAYKEQIQTVRVSVPAGSPPPTRPPGPRPAGC